jgi:hypothetical protein
MKTNNPTITLDSVQKGMAVTSATTPGYAMNNNGTMNHVITDHLVSTVAVTDASGLLLEETRYMPFRLPQFSWGFSSLRCGDNYQDG